jgi:hypothetical protein
VEGCAQQPQREQVLGNGSGVRRVSGVGSCGGVSSGSCGGVGEEEETRWGGPGGEEEEGRKIVKYRGFLTLRRHKCRR